MIWLECVTKEDEADETPATDHDGAVASRARDSRAGRIQRPLSSSYSTSWLKQRLEAMVSGVRSRLWFRSLGMRLDRLGLSETNRTIYFITALGFVLRIAGSWLLPILPEDGDQRWYLAVARNIAFHGVPSTDAEPPFELALGRPPGLSLLIAPFFLLFGGSYRIPLMLALGLASASAIVLATRIAQSVAPGLRSAPLLAALLVAFSPYEIQLARYVMTEAVLTPLFLAFVYDCLPTGYGISYTRRLRLALLASLMIYLRLDAALLVLGPAAACAIYCLRRGDSVVSVLRNWGFVLGLMCLVCLPYSVYVSVRAGRIVVVANAKTNDMDIGIMHWTAVTRIPEPIWWRTIYDYALGRIDPNLPPDSCFDSPEQRDAARKMLAAVRDAHGPTKESEEFFEEIAREHRGRWSTWTLLPIERAFALWFDFGQYHLHGRPRFEAISNGVTKALLGVWVALYALVLALGFSLSLLGVFRPSGFAFVLSFSVLVKTFGELLVGILFRSPLMEVRYQVPVQVLAVILVSIAAGRATISARVATTAGS